MDLLNWNKSPVMNFLKKARNSKLFDFSTSPTLKAFKRVQQHQLFNLSRSPTLKAFKQAKQSKPYQKIKRFRTNLKDFRTELKDRKKQKYLERVARLTAQLNKEDDKHGYPIRTQYNYNWAAQTIRSNPRKKISARKLWNNKYRPKKYRKWTPTLHKNYNRNKYRRR